MQSEAQTLSSPLPGSPPSWDTVMQLIPDAQKRHPAANKVKYLALLEKCRQRELSAVGDMANILVGTRLGQFIEGHDQLYMSGSPAADIEQNSK